MNSPICITPSKAAAVLGLAALLSGCAGDKPDPGVPDPGQAQAQEGQAGEKGQGNISFHYANKSTDANLAIDLASADVYLEMSGKAAQDMAQDMRTAERAPEEAHGAPARRAAQVQPREEQPEPQAQAAPEPPRNAPRQPGMPTPTPTPNRPPEPKGEPPAGEEDRVDDVDMTSRVLSGIRRAQELFYQKRYPEAMQAVRSSLDARPTAEGHALAGSIHYMLGQNGMARRQWLEALRLNPDMPAVVNMLEKTRTPGGRGSPSPRPIAARPSPRAPEPALPEASGAPFPEEYEPQDRAPAPPAPVTGTAPTAPQPASAAPPRPDAAAGAAAPAPDPQPPAAPAPPAPAAAAPAKASPAPAAKGGKAP